jgi:hypothetical protein
VAREKVGVAAEAVAVVAVAVVAVVAAAISEAAGQPAYNHDSCYRFKRFIYH